MRMTTTATLATAAVIAAASAVPAHALTIDFTTKTGDTLTEAQAAAFDLAAKAWSAILKNDVTLSIQVGFAALEHGTLGATSASFVSSPAKNVADALRTGATSAADRQAVAFLNPASASSLTLTSAQAKALRLAPASFPGSGWYDRVQLGLQLLRGTRWAWPDRERDL